MELKEIARQVLDADKDADLETIKEKVWARVQEEGLEQPVTDFLLSGYLRNWLKLAESRKDAHPAPRAPALPVRRTAPVPPAARREAVLEALDNRPIRIPTLRSETNPDGVISYGKMDQVTWGEFIRFHERQSRGHATTAVWGRDNLRALTGNGAKTMAELPVDVKTRLLARNPTAT